MEAHFQACMLLERLQGSAAAEFMDTVPSREHLLADASSQVEQPEEPLLVSSWAMKHHPAQQEAASSTHVYKSFGHVKPWVV